MRKHYLHTWIVNPHKFVGIMHIKFVRIDKLIELGSKEYFLLQETNYSQRFGT